MKWAKSDCIHRWKETLLLTRAAHVPADCPISSGQLMCYLGAQVPRYFEIW